MATLKELCASVPASLVRIQQTIEVNARKSKAYARRMEKLSHEERIFESCKGTRTQKRVRQKVTRCGGEGTYVASVRTDEHSGVVCRIKK